MTPERWRQVNDLYLAALEQDTEGRRDLLDSTARTDPDLVAEVRSLLAHQQNADFLEQPAWAVAPDLLMDESQRSLAGTQVGPYRIIREIGRGGMGVVYEAEDTRLRQVRALKVLPAEYTNDPARRSRLKNEAVAAAKLTHPSIATLHVLEEIGGALFLVFELVRGETLRDELRRGPIPPDRLLPTLIELAAGLAAAHAAGVVHRDFKPENIVRCTDGHVKILDFGVAHITDSEAVTRARITQTGMAIGTPGYMAPEQLAGREVDARSDIFAFGVVGWELGTGTHPFGATPAELLARLTDMLDGRPVTAVDATLPIPGLEPVLRRCLRRNRDERFDSAIQLHAELLRLTSADRSASAARATASAGVQREASSSRATRPSNELSSDRPGLWWWQFHQAMMAMVIMSLPIPTWFVRRWDTAMGKGMFLIVLALCTISVAIRMNLLFTSFVHVKGLARQRRRVYATTAVVEALLGLLLMIAAAVVAGTHDTLAAILMTLAIVTVVSLGVIEPATTAAALEGGDSGVSGGDTGVPGGDTGSKNEATGKTKGTEV